MAAGGAIADLFVLLSAKDMGLIAKFGEGGAAGERMAVQVAAAMTEVEASVAKVAESTRMVVTAGDEMAVSWERDIAAMRAETASLAEGMVAAEAKAAESTAALGAATDKQAAKFSLLGEASGISNKALMGAGVAAAGAAVEFAKMAGNFQQDVVKLNTSAGETQANLKMVGDGILAMSGQVGYSSDQLATAMYKVESGGQHGADGLKVLQAAAEGAKAEQADLTTVSDALTSAMADYKFPADQAALVTSKLVAATGQGKMTFEELAGSMSAILPVASANHVSFDDIVSDLASMTLHGMSAQQASQNLADAIRHMASPTQVQAKELATLGLNATEVSKSLGAQGLSGTINEISNRITSQMGPDGMVVVNLTNALKGMSPAVQDLGAKVLDGSMSMKQFSASAKGMDVINAKQVTSFAALAGTMHGVGTEAKSGSEVYQTYSQALQKAMGDATGMNVALMIGGQNASKTNDILKIVSGTTVEAGNHVKGWAEIQQEFNFKLAAAKDGLGALAISIGEKLLPVLTPLVGALADTAQWLTKHKTAATVLAFALGGVLVVGLTAAAVATWTWFAALAATNLALIGIEAPLWVVIGVIAAIGFAVYEVIQHWDGIKDFFKKTWDGIKGIFEGAKDLVMAPIHAIAGAWDSFIGGFTNPAAKLADSVKGFDRFFIELGASVKRGFDAVIRFFSQSPAQMAFELGKGLGQATRAVVDFVTSLPQKLSNLDNLLYTKGRQMIVGLEHGVEDAAKTVWAWMLALPGNIMKYAGSLDNLLYTKGQDLLHGAERGIETGARAVWNFFTALPGHVIDFFKDAPGWLAEAGKNILVGLWNGFTGFIGNIFSGIGSFISSFIHGFEQGFGIASPSTVMARVGGDIIQGLWNEVVNRWNAFLGSIGGFPGQVINMFSGAAGWLVSAGYNILVGLYNGMIQMWNKVTSFVGSIGSWIAANKGPMEVDRALLTPHGNAIMDGLLIGLKQGHGPVRSFVQGLAGSLQATMGDPGLDFNVGARGFASAGGGGGLAVSGTGATGGGINIVLNVAGHVWTTQDLVRELQTQLLQHGIRNNNAGIAYAYA